MADSDDIPESTVHNILEQDTLKWVFVGGKGGVGKTTCSSIISMLLARVRPSVLIISTDPAHNLSDAFQQRFTKTPTLVYGFKNLYAMEVDPSVDNDEFGTEGMDSLFSDLANAIPGIDEAMSFGEMLNYYIHSCHSSHVTRIFGVEDEFGEDAIIGRLEGMKNVIEQVNKQFKDPDLTTFICVCIPEFLSLYETERLVQELTKFEIDTHNIIINQVLFDDEDVESKLLKARMRMQQKYLDQFFMLYDDFHITKLPLLPEEVTGVEALKRFSRHFITPYQPSLEKGTVEEVEQRLSRLKEQLAEAEAELEKL
ncbi:hypothetical protein GOBAR_DD05510 [Gossypium barbadense]|nr:hypothetical protein GOBAR_DD05510 [Gossypium barbadense]